MRSWVKESQTICISKILTSFLIAFDGSSKWHLLISRILSHIFGYEILMRFCFLNLQFSSSNGCNQKRIPFVSVEKTVSEPKMGSNSGSSTFQCVASGSILHFVCNTTVGCISYLPFTTTNTKVLANRFYTMFWIFMKMNCFSFVIGLALLKLHQPHHPELHSG
jgi:hypothetical protein